MADEILTQADALTGSERGVAAVGTAGGFAALFSAAACCVLPLAFAALGLGAGGLAALVPYHWPLTIFAAVAVAAGWLLYVRRQRECAAGGSCTPVPPKRATFVMLVVATVFVALAAIWKGVLEAPLMAWLTAA